MLILSRKKGEALRITANISITVSLVHGGRVRLSINAPPAVRVIRQEVLQRSVRPQMPTPSMNRPTED